MISWAAIRLSRSASWSANFANLDQCKQGEDSEKCSDGTTQEFEARWTGCA
ncbi:hypothetical protein Vi05172_g6208 [Venturia inaequalis]|nr:hypothetical protein Vi05172_g6208 [Venturia inaequalis]